MFGVSIPELLLVLAVILLVFGPDRLPQAARTLGKWTGFLRRQSDALRREFYQTVYQPTEDIRKEMTQGQSELKAIGNELRENLEVVSEAAATCPQEQYYVEKEKQEAAERLAAEQKEAESQESDQDSSDNDEQGNNSGSAD